MTSVHLCILGCGAVARLHSRVARSLGKAVTLSFASRSAEKAEAYRRRFGGRAAFGSYEAACASPDVDAVFLCTPHAFHLEQARLAAAHRKAMLIEKPLARTLEEAAGIEAAAAQSGAPCMVAENYFFKPLVQVLREHLDAGDIGSVRFIEVNRANRSRVQGWRADPAMMGGGALLEGGVHWVNFMCSLGGAVDAVLAARPDGSAVPAAPFEDSVEVIFKYAGGSVGKLLHSWNLVNRFAGLQGSKIYGSDGNIHFESNGLVVVVSGRRWRLRFPGALDLMGYRAMLRHFLGCVRERREPAMSVAVARRDLAIVFAAYRSLQSERFERPVAAVAAAAAAKP